MDAVYLQALKAVRDSIVQLDLENLDDNSIEIRKFPWDDVYIHHGVTISWNKVQYGYGDNPSTNERDMIRYPCVVTIIQGTGKGDIDDLDLISTWREQIFRKFNNKRLEIGGQVNVNSVICWVEDEDITLPALYKRNYDAQQMTIWALFLEPREIAV